MDLNRCKPFLGTFVDISLSGELAFDELAELSNIGYREIEKIHDEMSFHSEESLLSQVNRSAHLSKVEISQDLYEVLDFGLKLFTDSNGVFDFTVGGYLSEIGLLPDLGLMPDCDVGSHLIYLEGSSVEFAKPMRIDLGGIAKGYAVDKAYEVIRKASSKVDIWINAGGDLRSSAYESREVSILTNGLKAKVYNTRMSKGSLATTSYAYVDLESGHVVDTRANLKVVDFQGAVSVFADSCMLADALTKVAVVNPKNSVFEKYGVDVLVFDRQGDLRRGL